METKYVEGYGLSRIVGENLTKTEAELLKKEVDDQKHGVSGYCRITADHGNDHRPSNEDTYTVWQRIVSDANMRDEIRNSMQPKADREQFRALKTQFNDRYHDLNFKVNVLLGAASAAVLGAIGAFLVNVCELTPSECVATLAIITIVVLTILWIRCEAKRCRY